MPEYNQAQHPHTPHKCNSMTLVFLSLSPCFSLALALLTSIFSPSRFTSDTLDSWSRNCWNEDQLSNRNCSPTNVTGRSWLPGTHTTAKSSSESGIRGGASGRIWYEVLWDGVPGEEDTHWNFSVYRSNAQLLAGLEFKTDFLRHELTRSVFYFLRFCLFYPSVGFKAGILKECESSLPSRGPPHSIYREASLDETHWIKHYCVFFPNLCTHVYTHINHCQQSCFCIKPTFLSLRYLPFLITWSLHFFNGYP